MYSQPAVGPRQHHLGGWYRPDPAGEADCVEALVRKYTEFAPGPGRGGGGGRGFGRVGDLEDLADEWKIAGVCDGFADRSHFLDRTEGEV